MGTVRKVCGLAAAVATLAVATTASAQRVTIAGVLNGDQEVGAGNVPAPTGSPGSGSGRMTWDAGAGTLSVTLRFSGLLGTTVPVPPPTGAPAHIHAAPPGANGGIVLPLFDVPTGITGFSFSRTFTTGDLDALLNDGQFTGLITALNGAIGADRGTASNLYFNVHTTRNGAGEIRGDLAVVPEPSTYALMATGLGLVGAISWRRRRAA